MIVSQTVKDLVAGAGLVHGAGDHELKGIPGTWRLYAVLDPPHNEQQLRLARALSSVKPPALRVAETGSQHPPRPDMSPWLPRPSD